MSQYKSQIQNHFLSTARKRHIPVEVVLNTGTSLRGKVKGYDQFSITLNFKNRIEVIYKSSILFVTLLPKKIIRPVSRPFDGPPRDGPPRDGPRPPSRVTREPPVHFDDFESEDPPPPKKGPAKN